MAADEPVGRVPSFNLPAVFGLKHKIIDDIDIIGFLDSRVEGENFEELVRLLQSHLPDNISHEVLRDTCIPFVGEKLTREVLSLLAWRIAGNLKRLRNGHSVLPWGGFAEPTWVPVQVLDVGVAASYRGKTGGVLTLKVLAGQPCPNTFKQFWTRSYCQVLATRLGFTKRWGDRPFHNVAELVNFRFLVRIIADTGELTLDHVACPSSLIEWNRQYMLRRARKPGVFQCPAGHAKAVRCFQCYVGQDRCPVATHANTYFAYDCPSCKKEQWFNSKSDAVCVDCKAINALKRRDAKS